MTEELFSVKDKIVLITGSTRGLGFSFASGFADAGAVVVFNGRNREAVDNSVNQIRQNGGQAYGSAFDVCNETEVEQGVEFIEKSIGPVHTLINNAGIQRRNNLENLSLEDWKAVIDVNLNSAFIVSRAIIKGMIARKSGKIINITSLMAEGARPTTGNYCAAKGGLKMLTKAMATEWGRYNVQVNAIGPGYFITDLTKHLTEDEKFDAWVKQKVPLGRWGDPSELIGSAIYLSSRASDYINGQTIYVDGGWLAAL